MYNSLEVRLSDYGRAMFEDIAWLYSSRVELSRDIARFLSCLGTRGSKLLTLELPAVAKSFLKGLRDGTLHLSGALTGTRKGTRLPKFLGALFKRVFHSDGTLMVDPCHESVRAILQITTGFKNLQIQCSKESVNEAVKTFISIESSTREPSLNWGLDLLDGDDIRDSLHICDCLDRESDPLLPGVSSWPSDNVITELEGRHLQVIADSLASRLTIPFNEGIAHQPKHGPGAVANHSKEHNKYAFTEWPRKLEWRYPFDWYSGQSICLDSYHSGRLPWWSHKESPSRLISVPKTQKTPRLIAAEPSQHQWIQQLILGQLETAIDKSVLKHCISLRSQAPSRILAISGSSTGAFATVDLSSASDRLSCWAVERIFRRNIHLLDALHACRTRYISNTVDNSLDRFIRLRKFATQGSATVFPLQTICYAIIAIAAVTRINGRTDEKGIANAAKSIQVFGDDIIVPVESLELLTRYLVYLGLRVNTDKTYGTGKFRESCGMDAYDGVCVTPVYVRSPALAVTTRNLPSFVEVRNNFYEEGYWHTARLIDAEIGALANSLPMKKVGRGTFGLSSHITDSVDHLKSRWNDKHQVREYKVLKPYVKAQYFETDGYHMLSRVMIDGSSYDEPRDLRTTYVREKGSRLGWDPLYELTQ